MTTHATEAPVISHRKLFAFSARNEAAAAWCALALILMLQFPLVWQRAIHWDETWHYSLIEKLNRGTLTSPLQTFFLRLVSWITELPGNSIDHIVAGRMVMFACECATVFAIIRIATRFADQTTGVLCACGYLSAIYVFQHGFSLRADPVAAALLMNALALFLTADLRIGTRVAIGILLGICAMVTIKMVLYAGAFAGVAWLRWNEAGRTRSEFARFAQIGLVAAASLIVIFIGHSLSLAEDAATSAGATVSNSLGKMFVLGVLPYWGYALVEAARAPFCAILILATPVAIMAGKQSRPETVALTGLFSPLLTLLFYHNTAPYYYAYMLPPVLAASAVTMARARTIIGATVFAAIFGVTALGVWWQEDSAPIAVQRQLVDVAERTFPQRTAYFDFSAFLGRFPKANTFMTPWGVDLYLHGKGMSMREAMAKEPVPLVMDNDPMFTRLLMTREPTPEFLPADAAAVRDTYIHFWGPFWIAGQIVPRGAIDTSWNVLVPGPYTAHGNGLTVDGKVLADGSVIELSRGAHRLSGQLALPMELRWGDGIATPQKPEPTQPFWTPF